MKPKLEQIAKRVELAISPEQPDISVLYLYGYISSSNYWGEDDVISTAEVMQALQGVTTSELHVRINSFGGSAFEGIAIHNLLKQHPAKVIGYVDGIAASAASIVLMAADKVVMPENTMQMIHCAHTIERGNADAMRKCAAMLDKVDAALRTSYMSRFVGTEKQLEALLKEDTWLTAAEAAAMGLCDEVICAESDKDSTTETEPAKNAVLSALGYPGKPEAVEAPTIKLDIVRCMDALLEGMTKKGGN
jgi:ATP-dependent protease ClpP protease subunit